MKITKKQLMQIIKEEVQEAKKKLLHDGEDMEDMEDMDDDDAEDMGHEEDFMGMDDVEDMHEPMHDEEPMDHHDEMAGEDDMEHHDLERRMAKSDLYKLAQNAQALCDMVDHSKELPAWVQSKIATAADRLDAVYHYMTSEQDHE
jgi:hypothetical protein